MLFFPFYKGNDFPPTFLRPNSPQPFHRHFFPADANPEENGVKRQTREERRPRVAEQRDTDQLGNNIEEIIGMAHGAEKETPVDALTRNNVELHSPDVPQFVHNVKEDTVRKDEYRHTCPRKDIECRPRAVSLIECAKVIGDVGEGEEERIGLTVLHGTCLFETFLVVNGEGKRDQAQGEKAKEYDKNVHHKRFVGLGE